ncbi:alpha/beta fold hydrolase [Streptomyces sp. NPDC015220]|uniref:alpha/beta fold hydrolase n=1 Tax=Streptomyces sp. NPDC015220 TaxID=3364947 RepID=UPI0037002EDF
MARPLTPRSAALLRTLRVLLLALLVSTTALTETAAGSSSPSSAPPCVAPEAPRSRHHDAATEHDTAFNRDFRHCLTTVRGVQMHYVVGGTGPQAMVPLHGWPESWFEYRQVMPRLLPGRTVVAIDLPGMGDSTGRPAGHTKSQLAGHVHDLLARIGAPRGVRFLAHDSGARGARFGPTCLLTGPVRPWSTPRGYRLGHRGEVAAPSDHLFELSTGTQAGCPDALIAFSP